MNPKSFNWDNYGHAFVKLYNIQTAVKKKSTSELSKKITVVRAADFSKLDFDFIVNLFYSSNLTQDYELSVDEFEPGTSDNKKFEIKVKISQNSSEASIDMACCNIMNTLMEKKIEMINALNQNITEVGIGSSSVFYLCKLSTQKLGDAFMRVVYEFIFGNICLAHNMSISFLFDDEEKESFWVKSINAFFQSTRPLNLNLNKFSIQPNYKEPEAQKPKEEPKKKVEAKPVVQQMPKKKLTFVIGGPGESGKTTFVLHLKLLLSEGIDESDRNDTKFSIKSNLIEAEKLLIEEGQNMNVGFSDNESFEIITNTDSSDENSLTSEILDAVKEVWEDDQIQELYSITNSSRMPDNIDYFFDKVDDVFDDDYTPTDEDVLKTRRKTIGIIRNTIQMSNKEALLIDLGGQMSERGKYKSITEEVDALIYTISLCDYDRIMYENDKKSRKDDQVDLFDYFLENEKYTNKPVFLICNKTDQFEKKIKNSSFRAAYPDFSGDETDVNDCINYYIEIFKEKAKMKGVKFASFAISAVNPDDVKSAMKAILQSF